MCSRSTTDPSEELQEKIFQPIEGYEKLPLVSLEEACHSLISKVQNLEHNIVTAKTKSQNPADGLTQDMSAAIYLYTMEDATLYKTLNDTLRSENRQELKDWFSYLKLLLTALYKLKPAGRQTIWRGVQHDLSADYQIGEHYTWWSFTSCTASVAVQESPSFLGLTGPRTLFSIECSNGRDIKKHSAMQHEDEILLMPGLYLEVVSKLEPSPGLHIIHMREKPPPHTLLSPPFIIGVPLRQNRKDKRVTWSDSCSPWRKLDSQPGICVEGLCSNSSCQAFNQQVIISIGLTKFDFGASTSTLCPICKKYVTPNPNSCGFNNCWWRWHGRRQENGKAPRDCSDDWQHADDAYHYFDGDSIGTNESWRHLVLEAKESL
ncbi:unnamed protein product [Adineta steineri]|uniref:NAD(P)(+)--arginine ADP-ribosyltransferase n=1 Tax=Adineta steineri TaxID=433720 RepID=A0A819P5P0_9BILA|nr:unnamed protein product [Adineta steineri]CAF4008128.1 unnamed protein product [Adineta steineri]